MVYEIIPIKLGRISIPYKTQQPWALFRGSPDLKVHRLSGSLPALQRFGNELLHKSGGPVLGS